MRGNPTERFWAKVDRSGECWLWTGAAWQGYGRMTVSGRTRIPHRLSWEIANGPIPKGISVLHRCDNPPCVRPDHLFLGTQADNVADMMAKGRVATGERSSARTHPERRPRGERHPSHRLTEAQVRSLRREYAAGTTKAELGRSYGIGFESVRKILDGRSWGWLTD